MHGVFQNLTEQILFLPLVSHLVVMKLVCMSIIIVPVLDVLCRCFYLLTGFYLDTVQHLFSLLLGLFIAAK